MPGSLEIDVIVSEPFYENTYIVNPAGESKCIVFDPGMQPELILDRLRERSLEPEVILLTHGHIDHIAGCEALKAEYPTVPIVIGAGDARMLSDPLLNMSAMLGMSITSPPADMLLHEGQQIEAIGMTWDVLEIPGHSPGHIVYILNDADPPIVFGGDVLFRLGIGRFDFPGCDGRELLKGIKEKLYELPPDTVVYPGHNEPTTIGYEKANNPYTTGQVRLF